MIKQLEIKNFLSHKATTLEFSPGVNIIVGPTDSGKSAIVRALRWVVWNRPVGDSFRSHWGGDTEVNIDLDNGQVSRLKTDKENLYVLGMHDEFTALRTDVPEEIVRFLDMDEINLLTQFESHFLLSKSAGEVAQHFNRVAHLDKIDVGLRNIQKWTREKEHAIRADENLLEELNADLELYVDLPVVEARVKTLELLEVKIGELKNNTDSLAGVIQSIWELNTLITQASKLIPAEGLVNEILAITDKVNDLNSEADELDELVFDIEDLNEAIQRRENETKAEPLVDELLELSNEIRSRSEVVMQLLSAVNYTDNLLQAVQAESKSLKEMEAEFHKYMGEVCPLCGQKIK